MFIPETQSYEDEIRTGLWEAGEFVEVCSWSVGIRQGWDVRLRLRKYMFLYWSKCAGN